MAGDACVDVEAAFTQAVLALLKVELDLPSPTLSPALPFLVKLHAVLKGPLEEGLKNVSDHPHFPEPIAVKGSKNTGADNEGVEVEYSVSGKPWVPKGVDLQITGIELPDPN